MSLRVTRQYVDVLESGSGAARVTRQYVDVLGADTVGAEIAQYPAADHIAVPNPYSPEEVRRAFQRLINRTDIIIEGSSGQTLVGTAVNSMPAWGANDTQTFTKITVDNITIDGAAITSSTGAISFGNENLTTTGVIDGVNVTSGSNPGHTHTGASLFDIDHGSLLGLADDDHTQYFLVNGTRALSAYVDFPEIAIPANPGVNNIRVFAVTDADFTVLETVTDLGIVNRINQDTYRVARNTSGVSIAAAKAVYFTGSTGNKPNFSLAKANAEATMPAIGMTTAVVANNTFGEIMILGRLAGVKTDYAGWTEGAQLYVDPSTAGELTHVRPVHPNLAQWIGTIEVVHATNGAILVATRDITGVESGTNRNTYTIGDTLASDKTLKFDAAADGTIVWDGTVFTISGGITTAGTINTTRTYNVGGSVVFNVSDTYTGGTDNLFIGLSVAASNSGNQNVGIGKTALTSNTTGSRNVAMGFQSLYKNTIGADNFALGYNALYTNVNGNNNVAIGKSSLGYNTGSFNIGIGEDALLNQTNGNANTGIGYRALYNATGTTGNICIGKDSGWGITTGGYNVIIGNLVQGLSATLNHHIILADGEGNKRIVVDNNGKVGIYNFTPLGKLHVECPDALAVPALYIEQKDLSEELVRFVGQSTTDNTYPLVDAADLATPGAIKGWIKIYIKDDQATNPIVDGIYYLPFYDTPTA